MKVAVVGAGIQGCTVALELADRGACVDLIDRAEKMVGQASRWNEGKLHLGYVYARDRTLATARSMINGSSEFTRWLERQLGSPIPDDRWSRNFVYAACRQGDLTVDQLTQHFERVDQLIEDAGGSGRRGTGPTRRLTDHRFDPERVAAAFETPERSIDTEYVADMLRRAVDAHPRVSAHNGVEVSGIRRDDADRLQLSTSAGARPVSYDHVVNATWQNRVALDRSVGIAPDAVWVHRYKLALHVDNAPLIDDLPSTTFVHGPFGDIVNFGNGRYYLSWYPSCRIGFSTDVVPPDFEQTLDERRRATITATTIAALTELAPSLGRLDLAACRSELRGGYIVARASSDIDDASSLLHQRTQTGVRSSRTYHSIDTGKYCLAPYHARLAADRIVDGR